MRFLTVLLCLVLTGAVQAKKVKFADGVNFKIPSGYAKMGKLTRVGKSLSQDWHNKKNGRSIRFQKTPAEGDPKKSMDFALKSDKKNKRIERVKVRGAVGAYVAIPKEGKPFKGESVRFRVYTKTALYEIRFMNPRKEAVDGFEKAAVKTAKSFLLRDPQGS